MTATERIERQISDFFDSRAKGRWVVGISGGADSTALVIAMKVCGIDLLAVHCNYGLRGDESDEDENFVRQLCRRLDIDLTVTRFDTINYRKGKNVSIEMACRELRYDFFRKVLEERNALGIVVAHNRNDNAETLLLNLFRGTGIKGLRGMKPDANGIFRPLLDISRDEIEEYLKGKDIPYRTDSTNLENDFTRNRIRNVIMPFLRDEFPGVDQSLELTRKHLQQTELYLEEKLREEENCFSTPIGLDVRRILKRQKEGEFVLYSILSEKGFTASQIENIADCEKKGLSGKTFCVGDKIYLLDRGELREMTKKEEKNNHISHFSFSLIEKDDFKPGNNLKTAYFDAENIDLEGLSVRCWEDGDRMTVFGMKGTKKLSDIFSDAKISLDRKHIIPLLMYGSEILWIPGVRRSNLFPVTSHTCKILRIHYLK